jgi:hypothetical protein
MIRVASQAEFEAAIAAGDDVEVASDLWLSTSGTQSPVIRIVGAAKLTLVAWESSQPHVVARGSSQPHVVARGICQLAIRGAVKVIAAATVAIVILGGKPSIEGGGFVQRLDRSTPRAWCDYHGVRVEAGVAILFKVVRKDFTTPQRGFAYRPGTAPVAPDWDGGGRECGGGLHFSPTTHHALEFSDGISRADRRFVACPVALATLVVHPDGQYPQKVKAPGLAGPCWECDEYGKPVAGAVVWSPPAAVAGDAPKKAAAKTRAKPAAKRSSRKAPRS